SILLLHGSFPLRQDVSQTSLSVHQSFPISPPVLELVSKAIVQIYVEHDIDIHKLQENLQSGALIVPEFR
ncbi:hypothetical protein, partial [Vibrio mediterranei]|uniref:hypothetical protein n=1 Tax=Vibrio mediterranei TaxID=689 RepID=UPI00406943D9